MRMEPSNSTGSAQGASTRGVEGAVLDLGLQCIDARSSACSCAESSGNQSRSSITAMCLVAGWTAPSFKVMESSVQSLSTDTGPLDQSNDNRVGLRPFLMECYETLLDLFRNEETFGGPITHLHAWRMFYSLEWKALCRDRRDFW